jgi:hypothetical protein
VKLKNNSHIKTTSAILKRQIHTLTTKTTAKPQQIKNDDRILNQTFGIS